MLTVDKFIEKNNLKTTPQTVQSWCKQEYIPGAKTDDAGEWLIPDHAMIPYTELRYKGKSPYYSMVNACIKQRHIVAKLYKMDEKRFQSYIDNLIAAGFISKYIDEDGIVHYTQTTKGEEALSLGRYSFNKKLNMALAVLPVAIQVAGAVAGLA